MKSEGPVVILGGGVSGRAAAHLAEVLRMPSVILYDGEDAEIPHDAQLIVASPGMHPLRSALYKQAAASGIEFISELEFASRHFDLPCAAITGTNGKTTTTEIVTLLLNRLGIPAVAAGNIGLPLSEVAARRLEGNEPELAAAAVEVSSFQLELTTTFAPRAAVLLNLASDHVERYAGGFDEYCRVKEAIFDRVAPENRIRGLSFAEAPHRVTIEGDALLLDDEVLLDLAATKLNALHNRENLAAATEVLLRFVPDFDRVKYRDAVREYRPGRHRIETVAERSGVTYVDDSKATNPASVLAAVEAMPESGKVVLILGGLGKGMDFTSLRAIVPRLRAAVLIGEARHDIAEVLRGELPCADCERDFEMAVRTAAKLAEAGDTVLLSPACASMDMFRDYLERGDRFAELVDELP